MFHIVINDLGDRPQNMLIKFGGHTKLRSIESTLEGRIKIQNYSDKLHLCPQKGKITPTKNYAVQQAHGQDARLVRNNQL